MKSSVHPKYKTQYHVGNWPAYDRALVQRGDITVWLAPDAIATWEAVGVGKRGGQRQYSDLAIETALTLRLIFHLPLRQTEGFLTSIFGMLGLSTCPRPITPRSPGVASISTSRCVAPPQLPACISLSTARDSRSWARVNGPRRNMEDGGGEAGRSCISVSTDRV